MPNPFLLTETLPAQALQQPGDLQYGGSLGGGIDSSSGDDGREPQMTKPGPPQRPPPPQTNTQATASPAHSSLAAQQPKSAFDDLNESIRMALGGSPAKQSMASVSGSGSTGGTSMVGGPGYGQQQMPGYQQQHQQQMYSSPAKQPMGIGFCYYLS